MVTMATFTKRPVEVKIRRAEPGETVHTREGTLTAEEGDLIAEGVEGEVYPIGPRILAQTYAPDDEEAREIYEEVLPPGVVVEFDRDGDASTARAVYVRESEISNEEEREEAEAFVRKFIASAPNLNPGDAEEVPYA